MRDWLTESSTTVLPDGVLDDLIAFCEDDLNADRDFRLLEMQAAKLSDLNPGDEAVTLPTDSPEMQTVTETKDTDQPPLTYMSPDAFAAHTDMHGHLGLYTIVATARTACKE